MIPFHPKGLANHPFVVLLALMGTAAVCWIGLAVLAMIFCTISGNFMRSFDILLSGASSAVCTQNINSGVKTLFLVLVFFPLAWGYRRLFDCVIKIAEEKLETKKHL